MSCILRREEVFSGLKTAVCDFYKEDFFLHICLKCHYVVTDIICGGTNRAPLLLVLQVSTRNNQSEPGLALGGEQAAASIACYEGSG